MYRTPPGTSALLYRGVWKLPTDEKKIYLTFDDGPCEHTQGLLSLLDEYHAKGTFFCLGKNAQQYPEVMSNLKTNGHRVGNHGYDHLNGWKSKNVQEYLQNIRKASGNTDDGLFRPPYGKTTLAQRKAIINEGYQIVMWTFNSKDYKKSIDYKKVVKKAKRATLPGSIFLFHDSQKATENTRSMLKELLPYWKNNGWKMAPLSIGH